MMSPVRYGQRKFRAGGTSGSIFSLIAATLGSGTLSFAYAVMMNGYVLGPILILVGALLSYYTGMLIVKSSEHTDRTRYEDIALALYGKKVSIFTSILNLVCLIGFTFSYIVYVKKAIPGIIEMYADKDTLPEWIANTPKGNVFWGVAFSFLILFPMSIPRNASALRYSSLLGVLCSMYLSLAVTIVFFTDKDIVPNTKDNFSKMEPFRVSYQGIVNSVPLIIFGYMYQVNIPMIYVELEKRNSKQMAKVVGGGSAVAVLFYVMVGVFGYATFANDPNQLCTKNILEADYQGNNAIQVGNFALLIAVMTASPLVVLPSKDTVEELWYKEKGMTKGQNFIVTLVLVIVNCVMALFIPNIGAAMTLVGSSINPIIGFILPVVFYWKVIKDKPFCSPNKIFGVLTVVIITIVSVLSLINFFQTLGQDDDDIMHCADDL